MDEFSGETNGEFRRIELLTAPLDADVSFVGASAPIVTGTTFLFVREPY